MTPPSLCCCLTTIKSDSHRKYKIMTNPSRPSDLRVFINPFTKPTPQIPSPTSNMQPRNLVPIFLFWPPIHSLSPLAAASVHCSPAMATADLHHWGAQICLFCTYDSSSLANSNALSVVYWGHGEREQNVIFFFFFEKEQNVMLDTGKGKKHFGWLVFFKAFRCYICHVSLVYLKMGENWRYLNGRWASPVQLHP